jgi:type IV secretion system protein VirB3/type IV secretion system protein VirB4
MRTVSIHQSLLRHNLTFGAERELVMISSLVSLLVGIGGMSLVSSSVATLFWFLAVFALRQMAKADPLMSKVWLRHIRQQDYYPAHSSIWRKGGFKC